jgi:acetyl-CoA carboxylase biotin carboxyl carrier protein
MNFKELKELIEIVSNTNSIEELEVERAGVRLRVRRSPNTLPAVLTPSPPPSENDGKAKPDDEASSTPTDPKVESADLSYVTSPMVGTFYRAPSPDAEPFVKVGDFVEKGTIVCIIEAMKLMNEIESDIVGEIVSIPVENGHPIEYGERLFAIRPH